MGWVMHHPAGAPSSLWGREKKGNDDDDGDGGEGGEEQGREE